MMFPKDLEMNKLPRWSRTEFESGISKQEKVVLLLLFQLEVKNGPGVAVELNCSWQLNGYEAAAVQTKSKWLLCADGWENASTGNNGAHCSLD
ncbi:hypothetical protein C5167_013926, partial [Papaver somniferum]